jgi:hypothetical protein
MRYLMMLGLALLFATGCYAGFEATIQGNARGAMGPLKGATIKVIADPLWGRANSLDFEAFKKEYGQLPVIDVSGSGTSDAKGNFKFKVIVSERDGELPTRKVADRRGNSREVTFIYAVVVSEHNEYKPDKRGILLDADAEQNVGQVAMQLATTATGKVIKLSDRKPVAGMKLRVNPSHYRGGTLQEDIVVETDKDGKFEVTKDVCPIGRVTLTSLDANWAFAQSSTAWSGLNLNTGANDLGTLVVVPGGSIKLAPIDSDTGKALPAMISINGAERGSQVRHTVQAAGEDFSLAGLPEGIYTATITLNNYWGVRQDNIEVVGGSAQDLGNIKLEPHRTLSVIAVSDDNRGIERYTTTVSLLEGTLPADLRGWGGRAGATYGQSTQMTAERYEIGRLFTGKWSVQVTADGYAAGVVTVDLPRKDPVTVSLTQGGNIEYQLFDLNGRQMQANWAFAVKRDSPEYKRALELKQDYRVDQPFPAGVYGPNMQQRTDVPRIDGLPAGDYLFIARSWEFGFLSQDNVMVEKGKTTSLSLKPELGSLTVTVTEKGKPKVNETVVVLSGQMHWQPAVAEHKTDANGQVVLKDLQPGEFMALSKREYDWARGNGQGYELRQRLEPYQVERQRRITYGVQETVTINLDDPGHCWFSVQLPMEADMQADWASLVEKAENRMTQAKSYSARHENGVFNFGRVMHGTYTFTVAARLGDGNQVSMVRQLTIDQSPEQTVKLDWDLSKLTIKVKLPKGVDRNRVSIALRQPHEEGLTRTNVLRFGRLDEKDQCVMLAVPEGSYDLVATVTDLNGLPQYISCQRIQVKGNGTENVKFDDKVGNLKVNVVGSPALGSSRVIEPRARVILFDAKGKEILPGDPLNAIGWVGREWMVYAVPAGTYRAVILAHGLQAFEIKEVKVKKGETTNVTANPTAAAMLQVTLKNFRMQDLQTAQPAWELEDEAGNKIPWSSPDGQACFVTSAYGNDMQLVVINIPPEAKKARLIAKGYEDHVLDVDGSAGKTNLADINLVPRED